MRKILVTGAKGQLGRDIMTVLKNHPVEAKGVDIDDFDLCDATATEQCIMEYRPDVVIHCAAYVAVDRAQEDREKCYDVNVNATANVAKACKKAGAELMYISTDYVFSGVGEAPYEIDGPKGPQNVYGATKYAGELAVETLTDRYYIARISWVFGVGGSNFIETMLRLAENHDTLTVVDDQIGSPTFTADAAVTLCDIALSGKYGIYHVTNEGFCSWNEFAKAIFHHAGKDVSVLPIATKDYSYAAVRPLNSRLSKKSLDEGGFRRLPDWEDALRRYLKLRKAD